VDHGRDAHGDGDAGDHKQQPAIEEFLDQPGQPFASMRPSCQKQRVGFHIKPLARGRNVCAGMRGLLRSTVWLQRCQRPVEVFARFELRAHGGVP
jgi:hypothetical protein